MAKRVVVSRQEFELTDEEAKQYILDNMFAVVGSCFKIEDFFEQASTAGIEDSKGEDLKKIVNQLIAEGKLRIEYEHVRAAFISGYILIIRRVQ